MNNNTIKMAIITISTSITLKLRIFANECFFMGLTFDGLSETDVFHLDGFV
jgi:hypothetical protein